MESVVFIILLFCGLIGDLVLPYAWGWVWKRFNLKTDTIILYDTDSPVCWPQRLWRLTFGVFLILGGISLFYRVSSSIGMNIIIMILLIITGAVGCIATSVISLTDVKYVSSGAAKLHNFLYFIGCICIQLTACICASIFFEHGMRMSGAVLSIISLISILLFVIYNMSDRLELKETIISYEAVWEFFFKLAAYIPLGWLVITSFASGL